MLGQCRKPIGVAPDAYAQVMPSFPKRSISAAELTIDLGRLAQNYRSIVRRVGGGVEVAAVVKADGYGLGAVPVAGCLLREGCGVFFVAHAAEGAELREGLAGAKSSGHPTILVLGGAHGGTEQALLDHDLVPVLNGLEQVERWSATARSAGRPLPAVLHVDTGMSRLGFTPDELTVVTHEPWRLDGIDVQLFMSHLASSDEPESPMNPGQRARFLSAINSFGPARRSLANSSGIFLGPDYHFDQVRPGYCLYGGNPTPQQTNPMQSVVTLHAPILQVRPVRSGDTVGYGATHLVDRPGRVATLGVGYGDGLHRSLSDRGQAWLAGNAAPIIGRVSMDLLAIDVTEIPESDLWLGAPVELIGEHRPIDAVATDAGTIGYEVLTDLARRLRRIYVEEPVK